MDPEIEIKVSESGTLTEIRNIDFQFRDNEYCYLLIYLHIYLLIYLFIYFYLFIYLFTYLFIYLFIQNTTSKNPRPGKFYIALTLQNSDILLTFQKQYF